MKVTILILVLVFSSCLLAHDPGDTGLRLLSLELKIKHLEARIDSMEGRLVRLPDPDDIFPLHREYRRIKWETKLDSLIIQSHRSFVKTDSLFRR